MPHKHEATDLISIIKLVLSVTPHINKLSEKFMILNLSAFLTVLKR